MILWNQYEVEELKDKWEEGLSRSTSRILGMAFHEISQGCISHKVEKARNSLGGIAHVSPQFSSTMVCGREF